MADFVTGVVLPVEDPRRRSVVTVDEVIERLCGYLDRTRRDASLVAASSRRATKTPNLARHFLKLTTLLSLRYGIAIFRVDLRPVKLLPPQGAVFRARTLPGDASPVRQRWTCVGQK